MQHRVEPSSVADLARVAKPLEAGDEVIAQFCEAKQYAGDVLPHLDNLCRKYGTRLIVRFYSHSGPPYGTPFSGHALRQLPSVAHLLIDCMDYSAPTDLEEVWNLTGLRRLHFGGLQIDAPRLLHGPNLLQLEHLGVGQTRRPNVDLDPIAGMTGLHELFISTQSKNIAAVGELPNLQALGLNMKKQVPLDFVPKLKSLRELRLVLGGREHIDDAAHPKLETLDTLRVRGLARIQPADFPNLKRLFIEEQAQLKTLEFSAKNAVLAQIKVNACKALYSTIGLIHLPRLEGLVLWNNPVLDFETWLAGGLPKSLQRCEFAIGRPKLDTQYKARLASLGYAEPRREDYR